jgi:hypothetical protein
MEKYPAPKRPFCTDEDESYEDADDEEIDEASQGTSTLGARDSSSVSYPSNIASACQEASVAFRQPKPTVVEDTFKLEKRRKSNRLSAQRWRMRKRSKFSDLQDKIRALQKDQEELQVEKSKLQAELHLQLALARTETTHLSPAFVAARLRRSDEALRLSRNILLGSNNFERQTVAQPGRSQGFQLPLPHSSFPRNVGMSSLKTSLGIGRAVNHYKPAFDTSDLMLAQRSASILSSFANPLTEKGVSMAELREMLRAATA